MIEADPRIPVTILPDRAGLAAWLASGGPAALLTDAGSYDVLVSNACGSAPSDAVALGVTCYANCDSSTTSPVLTANDFQCFLNSYAAGEPYANCDESSVSPTLTANDFQCFLNKFASGCL